MRRRILAISSFLLVGALIAAVMLPLASVTQAQKSLSRADFEAAREQLRQAAASADGTVQLPAALRDSDPNRVVSVYVVLAGEPAASAALNSPTLNSVAQVAALEAQQAAMMPQLQGLGAQVITSYQRVANAIQVRVAAGQLAAIRALPGVVAIEPVTRHTLANASSVPFIDAPTVWEPSGMGHTGAGMTVGIIDTGIDYTHADFGGAGTTAAYDANDPTTLADGGFPTAKVVGGYDFVGDDYDAGGDAGSPVPSPDADPLDCNGHGTHVAGTSAGYGVTNGGATYAGPYNAALDFTQFDIGPGVAPEALLYAIKVFGCDGSTDVVLESLEYAADPDGNGNFSDHLDVLNLSLGSPFGGSSITEQAAVDLLASLGTFLAISAGNSGDTFYITGSPASSDRAVSVAASIDDGIVNLAIQVNSPATIAGQYEAAEGGFTEPLEDTGDVSGNLVYAQPGNGCSAFTNAAAVSGNIALIDRGACTFQSKFDNAVAAGAIAAIVINNVEGPPSVMGGTSSPIPGVMISLADGGIIKAELAGGATVNVTLSGALGFPRPDLVDQIASFSSRGPRYSDSLLKPEISAPGFSIDSAAVGTGNEGVLLSGTSMAAPHIAGTAALLMQAHPNYTVEEIKAAMMNTSLPLADEDGNAYPESRVGAGRIDVDIAAQQKVTAVAEENPGLVSMSFGDLELADLHEETREVRLTNHYTFSVAYAIEVNPTVTETGVSITPLVEMIEVPGNGSAIVPFKFEADPTQFDMTVDVTTAPTQLGLSRHAIYEVSGQLEFRVQSPLLSNNMNHTMIHVPYHAVVRPASELQAEESEISIASGVGQASVSIPITGTSAHPMPIVTAFELGTEDADAAMDDDPLLERGDVLAIGAASDIRATESMTDTTVFFGLAVDGEWTTPNGYTEFDIYVDTDQNGVADAVVYNGNYGALTSGSFGSSTDTFVTVTCGPNGCFIDSFINIFSASAADTHPHNNSVLVMPASAELLGLIEDADGIFDYWVESYQVFEDNFVAVDVTEPATFNAANPTVDTSMGLAATPAYPDGGMVDVMVDSNADPLPSVLLLHHMNKQGERHEVINLVALPPTSVTLGTFEGEAAGTPWLALLAAGMMVAAGGAVALRRRSR